MFLSAQAHPRDLHLNEEMGNLKQLIAQSPPKVTAWRVMASELARLNPAVKPSTDSDVIQYSD